MLLLPRNKPNSDVIDPMLVGIEPVSLLSVIKKNFSFDRLATADGILPLNELDEASK